MTNRQALICAAVTGWKGDLPSSWPCPQNAETILDWGKSYVPTASDADLESAFLDLVKEALFSRILYPVFKEQYYYCSFSTEFIEELPDDLIFRDAAFAEAGDFTKATVKAMWDDWFDQYCAEYGPAWVWWGLCAGQGSQGPSDSRWGPCLGPSCCWHPDKKKTCNWNLEFLDIPTEQWPDMSFLDSLQMERLSDEQFLSKVDTALDQLRNLDPEFPWPPVDSDDRDVN